VAALTDCPRVEGDQNSLQRAARNLVENAVRHTPPGTKVTIRTERSRDSIKLVVSDDGPGLPRGQEEKVFERFARADGSADTTRSEGTGLGLAIVRAVAEAHGGSAVARRGAEGGAEFEIVIPAP
jgi:signal transduction histidine kinase